MTRHGSTIDAAIGTKVTGTAMVNNRTRFQDEFVDNVDGKQFLTAIANQFGTVNSSNQTIVTALAAVPKDNPTHQFQFWEVWKIDNSGTAGPVSYSPPVTNPPTQLVIAAGTRVIAVAVYA